MAQIQSFLKHIDQLRSIEWSRSYLWDVRFGSGANTDLNPAPPSPFDSWVPAIDYNEQRITSNTLILPYYLTQYKFLQTKSNIDIQMTIHDDMYGTMYYWLLNWHTKVFDSLDGVATLEDSYRQLDVVRLDNRKQIIKQFCYFVIPEGQIVESYNSSSDTKTYSLSFAVIGETNVPIEYDPDNARNNNQNTSTSTDR